MDWLLPKEFHAPCLPSLLGQVVELKLAERLVFSVANAFRVPSTNSKKDALSTLECIWHSSPLQSAMTHGNYRSWKRDSQQHVSRWQGVDKRMLGSSKKKTCTRAFPAQAAKKTIFSEFICSQSNDAPESAHSLDVCRMCRWGQCVRRCLVETRFHQAVMRLLSMKYHINSSCIVWVFLDGIFQSFVRFHQNANQSSGKEGTQRARLVLGVGRVRPFALLIITTLSKRLLCQNGMREVWHPSCKPLRAPLVCFAIRPVFVRPAAGTCVKVRNVSLSQIVNWRGCSSMSLNEFLVRPLVAYLPDEASRMYSE